MADKKSTSKEMEPEILEIDILEIDVEEVTSLLEHLGAKKVFEGRIDSVYFDFYNGTLNRNRKVLRLRKKGKEYTLTLKQDGGDRKNGGRREHEVVVSDFERAKLLLEKLGLEECQTDSRKRICYTLENSAVNINMYDNVPPFLEVKSPSELELKEIVKVLGFSLSKAKYSSEKEVVEHYEHIFPTTTRMP